MDDPQLAAPQPPREHGAGLQRSEHMGSQVAKPPTMLDGHRVVVKKERKRIELCGTPGPPAQDRPHF